MMRPEKFLIAWYNKEINPSLHWLPSSTVTDMKKHFKNGKYNVQGGFTLAIDDSRATISLPTYTNVFEIYKFYQVDLYTATIKYALKFEELDKTLKKFGSILKLQIDHNDGNYSDLPSDISIKMLSLNDNTVNQIEVGVVNKSNKLIVVKNDLGDHGKIKLHVGGKKYPLVYFMPYTWSMDTVEGYDKYKPLKLSRNDILEPTTDFCGKLNDQKAFFGFITPNNVINIVDSKHINVILGWSNDKTEETNDGKLTFSKEGSNFTIETNGKKYPLYMFTQTPLTSITVTDYEVLTQMGSLPVQNAIRLQAFTFVDPCECFNLTKNVSNLCIDFANKESPEQNLLYTNNDSVLSMGFRLIDDTIHLFLSNEVFLISFFKPTKLNGDDIPTDDEDDDGDDIPTDDESADEDDIPTDDESADGDDIPTDDESADGDDVDINSIFQDLIFSPKSLSSLELTSCEVWRKDDNILILLLGFPNDGIPSSTKGQPLLVEQLLKHNGDPPINFWIQSQDLSGDKSHDSTGQRFARSILMEHKSNFRIKVFESKHPDQDSDKNSFIKTAIDQCDETTVSNPSMVDNYVQQMVNEGKFEEKDLQSKIQNTIDFFIKESPVLNELLTSHNSHFQPLFQRVVTENISKSTQKNGENDAYKF